MLREERRVEEREEEEEEEEEEAEEAEEEEEEERRGEKCCFFEPQGRGAFQRGRTLTLSTSITLEESLKATNDENATDRSNVALGNAEGVHQPYLLNGGTTRTLRNSTKDRVKDLSVPFLY
ncbi:hypothetical protein HZH66_013834 [Vespula vulgaris]|uniref:Uncharacterized protein n=1 Tax=Vespula vulgaris TaxID=7454 RepID=A0A834MQZ0_VESVU|nr:hypothetical protein HZH66_013834 [Vespula vulgaris]